MDQNEQASKARSVIMNLGGMVAGGVPNLEIVADLLVEQDTEAIEIIKNHFGSVGWTVYVDRYLPENGPEGAVVRIISKRGLG